MGNQGGGRTFSTEDDSEIKRLVGLGHSAGLIAKTVGRSRSSVLGFIRRRGLAGYKTLTGLSGQEGIARNPVRRTKPRKPKIPKTTMLLVKQGPSVAPPIAADPLTIIELQDGPIVQCRAIIGGQGRDALYCATQTLPGTSWCHSHAKAYLNVPVRS